MFNERLRSARISRKITQQQMADMLNIAVRNYQKYESGDVEPSLCSLALIGDFLNVPTDFLLGRDDYLKSLAISVDVSLNSPPRRPNGRKSQ